MIDNPEVPFSRSTFSEKNEVVFYHFKEPRLKKWQPETEPLPLSPKEAIAKAKDFFLFEVLKITRPAPGRRMSGGRHG